MPPPVSALQSLLPAEQARVRSLIPVFLATGFSGPPAVVMLERALQLADMAIASGDAVEMLRAYNRLHGYRE